MIMANINQMKYLFIYCRSNKFINIKIFFLFNGGLGTSWNIMFNKKVSWGCAWHLYVVMRLCHSLTLNRGVNEPIQCVIPVWLNFKRYIYLWLINISFGHFIQYLTSSLPPTPMIWTFKNIWQWVFLIIMF